MEPTPPRAASPQPTARTAVVWALLRQELDRYERPLAVVDVGGGTGGFAVPLAREGHRVTVVDASPDALAALTRRAADAEVADRVTAVQGDADALAGVIEPQSVDLVLCHAVLEVVEEPVEVASAIAESLRPGGAASVVVAGRSAAVVGRALAGHLDAALHLVHSVDGSLGTRDTVRRRYDPAGAAALLQAAGLVVEQTHGVRVLTDLVPSGAADADPGTLLDLERAMADRPPYRDIAAQLHLLARRPLP